MKIEARERRSEYRVYIADDGEEFQTEKACEHYELTTSGKPKMYVIVDTHRSTNAFICIMDTRDKCQAWINAMCTKNHTYLGSFEIIEHHINQYEVKDKSEETI